VEGARKVGALALLGVAKVEEEARRGGARFTTGQRDQPLEDAVHAREHGPVGAGREVGPEEEVAQALLAEYGEQALPVGVGDGVELAEHDLAVVELERAGAAGI